MATNNIEIEAKLLVSEADYDKLLNALPFSEEIIVQTNYYLDSDDQILKRYGMILRVRKTGGHFLLTMKAPLAEGLLEKNQRLYVNEFDALLNENIFPRGEIYDFLDILHIDPTSLKILAQLTTERREVEYNDTSIDLSKNTYSGKVDYELECDSDSAVRSEKTIKELCDKLDIPFKLNTLSKEARAISAAIA